MGLKFSGGGYNRINIFAKGDAVTMRIIIDTEKERIILPKSFFTTLDRMNKILAEGGSEKKWTAEDYVKEQFNKAIKETMLRAEDKVVK